MQKELADILRYKISGLYFVNALGGLAQVVTSTDDDGTGNTITNKYPVSYNTNIAGNYEVTPERLLIPDSNKKSIIYFEDFGVTQGPNRGRFQTYTSRLRLVMWYDKEKMLAAGEEYKHTNAEYMGALIKRLHAGTPFNHEIFSRIKINSSSFPQLDAGIFSRYNYNETVRQYLRPPFDFFAIDLNINFEINEDCF